MSELTTTQKNYAIEFDDEQKRIIKDQFFPATATVQDMQYCMSVAKELGLNPILNEIYFVERKEKTDGGQWRTKIAPMAGRNAWLKLAHISGRFDRIESEAIIKLVPKFINGEWVDVKELVGIAKVYRTDREEPITHEVVYSEYVQKKQDGTPTKFWSEKPLTMIKKVAESQALRMAFNIAGIYDESEMEVAEAQSYESTALKQAMLEPKPKKPAKVTRQQFEASNIAETDIEIDAETGEVLND
jgi:phage recombination protein Bet